MGRVTQGLVALREAALVAWVGSLWSAGLLVAPLLFRTLPESRTAGDIAGRLFETVSWIGFASAALVFVLGTRIALPRGLSRVGVAVLIAMVLVAAVGHFGVRPRLVELRSQVFDPQRAGASMDADARARFGRWHAISGGLYLVDCLLGLALVVTPRRGERRD
jgi:hypothetical protein